MASIADLTRDLLAPGGKSALLAEGRQILSAAEAQRAAEERRDVLPGQILEAIKAVSTQLTALFAAMDVLDFRLQEVERAVLAPRERTPRRDETGRIVSVVDRVVAEPRR